jgi:hypothetical protein
MEKILIDGFLYVCEPGTNDRIYDLLTEAENSNSKAHENGIAYLKYNNFLEDIKFKAVTGEFILGCYTSI